MKYFMSCVLLCSLRSYGQQEVLYKAIQLTELRGEMKAGGYNFQPTRNVNIEEMVVIDTANGKITVTGVEGGEYKIVAMTNGDSVNSYMVFMYEATDGEDSKYIMYYKTARMFPDGEKYEELDILRGNKAKEFLLMRVLPFKLLK